MKYLHQLIAARVAGWRKQRYQCPEYPTISEILEYQFDLETGATRFLRDPQIRALETYWYLRLVEKTPHIFELYKRFYPKPSDLMEVLGLTNTRIKDYAFNNGLDALWEKIKTDDDFIREFKLESVRETLTLDYPSYILALAMGAGKTILIGAIIATEFAMAMEHPDGPFVENALVFAPGKTIIESLRELLRAPYEKILTPRLHRRFEPSVKFTFTRDGDPDIPVIAGSSFNVVVTNTEKIRIQKSAVRKSDLGTALPFSKEDEAFGEFANRRLRTIASLPHLAVFSDEAHHTYGQTLGRELKRVRQTVDYLHQNTNLICVVNTTGTPYFERQPLRDVVIWYGLAEGIRDGILKEVAGNILGYSFDATQAHQFVTEVVQNFFQDYADVRLPDGSPAKLAIYFPQTDDLEELRPYVESTLAAMGLSPSMVLRNIATSTQEEIDAFNRLNDPQSPYRVILLVDKGTEGWNCPSLFACALARKLRNSNNFVLQAASRCLRQIPGNRVRARIYLSQENQGILDRQLRETYGSTIAELNRSAQEMGSAVLVLRKPDIPPLWVRRTIRTVVPKDGSAVERITLEKPVVEAGTVTVRMFTFGEQVSSYGVLQQIGETLELEAQEEVLDLYTAAVRLAANYRLDPQRIRRELIRLYGENGEIPSSHLYGLAEQIEKQTSRYEVREEQVEEALALVKPDGFNNIMILDGVEVRTAEIRYHKDREHLLLRMEEIRDNRGGFGFHYTPYNFDSNPEKSFFEQLLGIINLSPAEVEDIYFTGALTDPDKTDFFVEYKDEDGRWRRYTPDFVIRKKGAKGKPGQCLIVEIKKEHDRSNAIDGEHGRKAMALRAWVGLNPDRLRYQLIFTSTDTVPYDQMSEARRFIEEAEQ